MSPVYFPGFIVFFYGFLFNNYDLAFAQPSARYPTLDNIDPLYILKQQHSLTIWNEQRKQDYDCFYASVFEAENPLLKSAPLAVQQKQIVVTCNYEARRRGLRKLQLIKEAKKLCPDVVVVLGEDLTKFRDASKELFAFLSGLVWGGGAEKLGFDEVFLDATPMIDYNTQLLNHNDLRNSFFQLDKSDPTVGFTFDATAFCGPTYPSSAHFDTSIQDITSQKASQDQYILHMRLILGSHLANYLRMQLEEQKRYTATVGVSTSKLLSKLAGNVHKPQSQTTLLPPYTDHAGQKSNVIRFLDEHDIGRIPGIGFKIAHRLRTYVLGRQSSSEHYEQLLESDRVTVGAVREFPAMGPVLLGDILRGGGWHRDIGTKVWGLLNGIDDSEVAPARSVPTQISIEDTYAQLDDLDGVQTALVPLTRNLIRRMHTDLTTDEDDPDLAEESRELMSGKSCVSRSRRWLAHPRTLRLSTRARLPPNPDGSRNYSATRISRSCPMPQFVFSFNEDVKTLAGRLVHEAIIPMFRKLHPDGSGWKLSLVNVAATNMVDAAGVAKTSAGRDIGRMFRTQERVLREWRVEDQDIPPEGERISKLEMNGQNSTDAAAVDMDTAHISELSDGEDEISWESDDGSHMPCQPCATCGAPIPHFAVKAHETFHSLPD